MSTSSTDTVTGESEASANPLLAMQGLPAFAEIRPEHVAPAVAAIVARSRQILQGLESDGLWKRSTFCSSTDGVLWSIC